MITFLKYPFPFKAWLTLSNDPDNTTLAAWHQLNGFIFEELKLDWANAVFPFSYNQNLPDQVCLEKHPEIAKQPIDTIHTWGDFVHAGQRGFSRKDAEAGIQLLAKNNIQPRVWVDHSRFTGNLLSNNPWGAIKSHIDASGVHYEVFEYSLDLIKQLGIAYVWSSKLTQIIGQDRSLTFTEGMEKFSLMQRLYFQARMKLRASKKALLQHETRNNVLKKHVFPDGNEAYLFNRFGTWSDADIIGLAKVISFKNIEQLIQNKGVMIAYTHLGKKASADKSTEHIPELTKACLQNVKKQMDLGRLKFTSLSMLLDYIVLRDYAKLDATSINFCSDGIRYKNLTIEDLKPHTFSVKSSMSIAALEVCIDGEPVSANLIEVTKGIYCLSFL